MVKLLYLISVLVRLPALHVLVQPILVGVVQSIALARRSVTTKLPFKTIRDPSNFPKKNLIETIYVQLSEKGCHKTFLLRH
jgi:hypothetical protein